MATLQGLEDVTFKQAQSGLEAIELVSLGAPDLVLLDLNMPNMHGLEVLQFLRSHASFAAIPVIVLTMRSDDASRTNAIAAGATQYMTKPFTPAELVPPVKLLLGRA